MQKRVTLIHFQMTLKGNIGNIEWMYQKILVEPDFEGVKFVGETGKIEVRQIPEFRSHHNK